MANEGLPPLEPCPFCGSDARWATTEGGDDSWEIQCSNNDCCIVLFAGATGRETAESWNRRDSLTSTRRNPHGYEKNWTIENHRDELIERLGNAIRQLNAANDRIRELEAAHEAKSDIRVVRPVDRSVLGSEETNLVHLPITDDRNKNPDYAAWEDVNDVEAAHGK